MKRIDTASRARDKFGAGKDGYQDGDPLTATVPTQLNASMFDMFQEEICNVIEGASIALDAAKRDQLLTAINSLIVAKLPVLSYAALDYPTISTSDNRLNATVASKAAVGGTVSVPAGVEYSIAVATSATRGRMRVITTVAWTSPDLDINSTYYLRAQCDANDAPVFYVQKGTDADAIPGSLKGTPNAASGGGFDSTVFDMLVAKIVTGAAGTVPTITTLANASSLRAQFRVSGSADSWSSVSLTWFFARTFTLNWARTPAWAMSECNIFGVDGTNSGGIGQSAPVISRYSAAFSYTGDWMNPMNITPGLATASCRINAAMTA